jgi:CheY-like chemotaxis protein
MLICHVCRAAAAQLPRPASRQRRGARPSGQQATLDTPGEHRDETFGAAASMPRQPLHAPLQVLLVEAEAEARAMLAAWLTLYGHQVMEAGDRPTALHMAHTQLPEVILLSTGLRSDVSMFLREYKMLEDVRAPVIVYAPAGAPRDLHTHLRDARAVVADALRAGRPKLFALLDELASH